MFREGFPAAYTETITSALSGSGVTAWPPEPELRETHMQLFHIYQTKKMDHDIILFAEDPLTVKVDDLKVHIP